MSRVPPPPVRVILVTHYFPSHRGGVETVAWEIASRLAASGAATITWYASGTDPAPPDRPGLRCVPVKACNVIEHRLGIPYPLWRPAALGALIRAVRTSDVVHLHDFLYAGNLVAWATARVTRRPLVLTQHVGLIPYRSRLLRLLLAAGNRLLGRLVLGSAAHALFVSEVVLSYFGSFVRFRSPPLRVPNGVDTQVFRPVGESDRHALRRHFGIEGDTPLLLFVGRFVEKKGLPLLFHLARRLSKARWLFVGQGPLDPASWRLANVEVRRDLTQLELAPLYQAADLLVLPSVGEGFPLVVQEAMACGTPAMVSDETAAACPEAAHCLLRESVALGDGDVRWAARIESLLSSPSMLRALRSRASEFAHANWSWERCAARYAEVFRSLSP